MRIYRLIIIALLAGASAASAQTTIPLWPNGTPESDGVPAPDKEFKDPGTRVVGGRGLYYIKEVSKPTLTVYRPTSAKDTGAASLVLPGGAYQRLAYDL